MNITSLLIYCFIITFTPGPTNIVILATVQNLGTKKAINYTFGATIAFGLLLVESAFLNSMLVTVIPKVLLLMQVIGSFYMIYLAYQLYNMDSSKDKNNETGTFISGFLMQFLNPKVVLFTMTVIPTYVLPYYQSIQVLTSSVIAITIIGFLAFCTWVLFGTIFKEFLQKHQKVTDLMMSLFLVYAAAMIWM